MLSMISPELYNYTVLNICVSAFLIIGTLGGAAWNIYAASVGWESLFPMLKGRVEYAVIGLSAIVLLGSLPVKEVITRIVVFGAIPIVCVVVNMIINFITVGGKIHRIEKLKKKGAMTHQHSIERVPSFILVMNNFAWIMGTVAGVLNKLGVWLVGVDSLIVSSITSGGITVVVLILYEIVNRSGIHN